jgi:hypothetical protein
MSANVSNKNANEPAAGTPAVPKRITNAQTVCNEKNEKGKLCNGHLKQLRTAGEASEVHLRGDDVLSKCQTCGTLYMGPPLGHVRDPNKQTRFVEAELTALLQAAGGTLPMIKKNEQGMFVIVEPEGQQATTKPAAAAKPAATTSATTPPATAAKPGAPAAAPKHKVGGQPNRQLFKRSTYAGVTDTGPVAGESFEQKVERLRKVSAGAKQRAEEGGDIAAPTAAAVETSPASETISDVTAPAIETAAAPVETTAAPAAPEPAAAHKLTGKADRTLMKRSTYCGVADTGPVPGESFEEKVARLAKVSAAAKQRADEGGQ